MNDIEILEKCISSANKQENFSHDTDYKWHKELASMIENLIQRNKDLEQILELMSKSLDNISYDQIPIAIEELKFKLQDLEQIEKEHKEENGRLRDKIKELEEIDLTTVYMDGFYDGEKKWKDKTQNKIQEINNKPQYPECIEGNENDIRLLQELLEESEK